MVNISRVRAIDIHAEAPFQQRPTVPETAPHRREQNIGAVIFPVDAERGTGDPSHKTKEIAELAARNNDVPIRDAAGRCRGRGSRHRDHSRISPRRWLAAFKMITIKDELRRDILKGHAAGLLGLA